MAEGFLRAYGGDRFAVESAGTKATELHPLAVRVMREAGVDIALQRSKSVEDVGEGWDVVVTVCDANCPIPPRSGMKLRWHFPDPALAGAPRRNALRHSARFATAFRRESARSPRVSADLHSRRNSVTSLRSARRMLVRKARLQRGDI